MREAGIERLCGLIRAAFRNVTLGAGVGLNEGNAIDDYAPADVRAAARDRDEADSWESIPVGDLNRCNYALSYFDAEGMRFHLPAFMIADLRGEFEYDLVFTLTASAQLEDQMRLLSPAQRRAVREYLEHCSSDPDRYCNVDSIDAALSGYWAR